MHHTQDASNHPAWVLQSLAQQPTYVLLLSGKQLATADTSTEEKQRRRLFRADCVQPRHRTDRIGLSCCAHNPALDASAWLCAVRMTVQASLVWTIPYRLPCTHCYLSLSQSVLQAVNQSADSQPCLTPARWTYGPTLLSLSVSPSLSLPLPTSHSAIHSLHLLHSLSPIQTHTHLTHSPALPH